MVSAQLGLGRLPAPDSRDEPYRIEARRLPPRPVHRVTKHWPLFEKPLFQGFEGTCVGHGWWHWLLAAPVIQKKILLGLKLSARELYILALAVDEWTQNDWGDMQFGTSVRSGAKVLKSKGLISEYNMTKDVYTMADWLGGKDAEGNFVGGPLVLGTDWTEGMAEPTKEGYIRPTGQVLGGHCYDLNGWNERRGVFYGINSHDDSPRRPWGKRGRFMIAAEDVHTLMNRGGEAWTAVEVRQPNA